MHWINAEDHARRAHRHYRAGRWRQALAELRLALDKDPTHTQWHVGLGLTLEALERYDEAAEAFTRAVQLGGPDREALLHLGINLLRLELPDAALDALTEAIAADRDLVDAYAYRVLAHALLEDHEAAELDFYTVECLTDEPSAIAYDHLAHSLAMRGRFERAIVCWQTVVELDPLHPAVHASLGRAYWRQGRGAAAVRSFARHLEHRPDDAPALTDLARVHLCRDETDAAESALRCAAEADPTHAPALELLARLLQQRGEDHDAQRHIECALVAEPARPGLRLLLAQAATRRGDAQQTVQHLRGELTCDGHTPDELLEVVRLLLEHGEVGRATGIINGLLLNPPVDPAPDADDAPTRDDTPLPDAQRAEALHYRGAALMLRGRVERGIQDTRAAVRLNPALVTSWHNLTLAYLHRHQPRRAAACLRRALRLQPDNPELRRLAKRLTKRGRRLSTTRHAA